MYDGKTFADLNIKELCPEAADLVSISQVKRRWRFLFNVCKRVPYETRFNVFSVFPNVCYIYIYEQN